MKTSVFVSTAASAALLLTASFAYAQQAAPAAPRPWTYKTKQLDRAQVDALLAKPSQVLVLDVRRPDEVTAKGSFPVYLSVQAKEVEKYLAFIPKNRTIVTLSNHAHRAGEVGDFLTTKGYKVAGAAGSEDYESQGGKITRIVPPVANAAAAAPVNR